MHLCLRILKAFLYGPLRTVLLLTCWLLFPILVSLSMSAFLPKSFQVFSLFLKYWKKCTVRCFKTFLYLFLLCRQTGCSFPSILWNCLLWCSYNFLPTGLSALSLKHLPIRCLDFLYWFSKFPIFGLPFSFSAFFVLLFGMCSSTLFSNHVTEIFISVFMFFTSKSPILFLESSLWTTLYSFFFNGYTVYFYLSENLNLIVCWNFFFFFTFLLSSL